MDGSSIRYSLLKIIKKEKVSSSYNFSLRLEKEVRLDGDKKEAISKINDSTYRYFEDISFRVPIQKSDIFLKFLN